MMTNQKGFTLIELMIVVAIIGILAAVAIPQYQNYVGKSNLASAVATLAGNKTGVEAYVMENGIFPSGQAAQAQVGNPGDANYKPAIPSGTTTDLGIVQPTFGGITLSNGNALDGSGYINVTFATGNPGIKDKSVRLKRDANGTWTCVTDADQKFIGKSCTYSATL
ncbi:type 4a pilus biogenesis protein PilA [Kistimonas scapharcae]|uniref:Type 4a pilus biogenesis protein PilA n=1 Tax=Kistimonas scapharcae TaxID=1036133 RepID=A0ABP8V4Q9_9GAMM